MCDDARTPRHKDCNEVVEEIGMPAQRRVLFTFWGRRGAISQFALDAARTLIDRPDIAATFSISRQNEAFRDFEAMGIRLLPIDTFSRGPGALLDLWRVPRLRRQLAEYVRRERIVAAIELMPHVWSPLLTPAIQAQGAKYATIIHDASMHPGDMTGLVKPLLDVPLRTADRVFTLSESVAQQLLKTKRVPQERLTTLFHPDFAYGAPSRTRALPKQQEPFKALFLGRIMPYKGLSLFVDAVERLQKQGLLIEPHIYGEGSLDVTSSRLAALGAKVVNRWLAADEIAAALAEAHAVILSHVEASQSGVAAAAFGAGVPVVSTPVGGLIEQVRDGETGLLARRVDADSLADAISRLINDPALYQRIAARLQVDSGERSMARFLDRAIASTLNDG
ncbi:MAG TPA: glycosyltransferase [Bosea sp. (in: a-proteobacteria)]|jgi:glycosyltransferase involved in cell wall biosynthesis|uniref:glycosyltransferase family 4 protein n=1 Tax=Bosea sp. (in: a-proteobacteria) TaxID=1871050 RepID=UPI002E0D8E17|nr:glycosyltransferase [Bosea sp. (in: a-proteobacteria)]